jgi:hypothetical protein
VVGGGSGWLGRSWAESRGKEQRQRERKEKESRADASRVFWKEKFRKNPHVANAQNIMTHGDPNAKT